MNIKYLILDVDGTLTDGKIYIANNGELFKAFDVKDGMGIGLIKANGIIPIIITGRQSDIVLKRANELGISHVYQGVHDKVAMMTDILNEFNSNFNEVAAMGDDINDLQLLEKCGFSGCPADAVNSVKNKVDFICINSGGNGAVREFIEVLLSDLNEHEFKIKYNIQ